MGRRGVKSFKRRVGHRPAFRSRKKATLRIATAALRGVKKIRSSIETKFVDIIPVSGTLPAPPGYAIVYLSGTLQGITDTTRIGDKINPTSLFYRIRLTGNSGGTQHDVRVLLVKDMYPKGVAPLQTDLFQTTAYESPLHRTNTERFKVLSDKFHKFFGYFSAAGPPAEDWSGATPHSKLITKYQRVSGRTSYKGATAAIGDSDTAHYFLMIGCLEATGRPSYKVTARMNYKDA